MPAELGRLSFMPKAPIRSGIQKAAQSGVGLLLKASAFLLVVSLAAFGATFLYKKSVATKIQDLRLNLEKERKNFDESFVLEVERMNRQIGLSQQIIENHRLPSHVFDLFEQLTHKEVRFGQMSFAFTPPQQAGATGSGGAPAAAKVTLTGTGSGYKALAEQAKIFESSSDIKSFNFSNFSLMETGRVDFSLLVEMQPSFILAKIAE